MKKKIALVALAAVAVGAQAADGISGYALIDGGIASSKITGPGTTSSKTEFMTGGVAPNFVGMKFEKSAEGITAGLQLEQGFLLNQVAGHNAGFGYTWSGLDASKNELLNRQRNLYVKGGFGTVVLGMQPNIAFNSLFIGDPRGGSNYGSSLTAVVADGGLSTIDNSSVSYTSPSISGFTVGAQYLGQAGDAADGVKKGNRVTATYSDGKLTVGVANYTTELQDTTKKNSTGTILAANYKLGDFTLKGLTVSQKNTSYTSTFKTDGVGTTYALNGKTTLDFGYYTTKNSDSSSYKVDTTAFGAYYKLMKDLTAYGQYSVSENKGAATSSWNFCYEQLATPTITAGQKATAINVGLMFSFF
jgi:predicted porin